MNRRTKNTIVYSFTTYNNTNTKRLLAFSILRAFRFSENLTHLFFLLSRHKFSSIATLENFNEEKREKKKIKIRKPKCLEYII